MDTVRSIDVTSYFDSDDDDVRQRIQDAVEEPDSGLFFDENGDICTTYEAITTEPGILPDEVITTTSVTYKGGDIDLLQNDSGKTLDENNPVIELLPANPLGDRLIGKITPKTAVSEGYYEYTFVTPVTGDAGESAFNLSFKDGRTMTLTYTTDVTGLRRGLVRVETITPTYRYLLGEKVATITTGVDTGSLANGYTGSM
jgi:hypothetical protein